MTADCGPRRPGARLGVVALPVLAAGLVAGTLVGGYALHPRPASAPSIVTSRAKAVRTDIVNTVQVPGSLGYGGSYAVIDETPGTAYTALPAPGTVIRRAERLYEVDGTPVALFYGARPEWRPLAEGVAPGPDVAQLDHNLIALGYGADLTISDYFTAATASAVELWQQAAGLPVTGTVPLGQIAFAPGPLRIAGVTPSVGSPPQPGTAVLTATSPVPMVTAQLPVTQEYLVHVGDHVTVTMPDGVTTTPGVVATVSPIAVAGNSGQDTVALTVRLIRPGAAGNLDAAPVTVNVVSARARDVLAVPISALVALAGGGYAVELVHGGGASAARQLVPVRTGLYSGTLVQVSGAGLAAGEQVEVPSS